MNAIKSSRDLLLPLLGVGAGGYTVLSIRSMESNKTVIAAAIIIDALALISGYASGYELTNFLDLECQSNELRRELYQEEFRQSAEVAVLHIYYEDLKDCYKLASIY